jgi:hypothetical protein
MRLVSGAAWATLVDHFGVAKDGGGTEGAGGEGELGPVDYLEEGGCVKCVEVHLAAEAIHAKAAADLQQLLAALSRPVPDSEAAAEVEAEAEAEAEAAAAACVAECGGGGGGGRNGGGAAPAATTTAAATAATTATSATTAAGPALAGWSGLPDHLITTSAATTTAAATTAAAATTTTITTTTTSTRCYYLVPKLLAKRASKLLADGVPDVTLTLT